MIVKNSQPVYQSEHFADWFAGFFEGDGGFCISRRQAPRRSELSLCIKQKDPEVLKSVGHHLGCGRMYTDRQGYSILKILRIHDMEYVIGLLNFRFHFAHRYHKFYEWVNEFDQRYGTSHKDSLRFSKPVTLTTGWLSGFMQAEGHFSIEKISRKKSQSSSLILRIGFTQNHGLEVFTHLKTLLNTGYLRRDKNTPRFVVSSRQGLARLVDYFHQFPLQGEKAKVQEKWIDIYKHRKIL